MRIFVNALLLALVILATGHSAPKNERALESGSAVDRRFGLFTRLTSLSSDQIAAGGQAARSSKAGLYMECLEWERIQPTSSTWDWSISDSVLAVLPDSVPLAVELFMVPGWANDHRGSYTPPLRFIANEKHTLTAGESPLLNTGSMGLLEVVTTAPAVVYRPGPDYQGDPATGRIRRSPLSSIPDGATVYCKLFLPRYDSSTFVSNLAVTLNGTDWVALAPGWTPESDDFSRKAAASLMVSSVPMATPRKDYDGQYGDPGTLRWIPGSALTEGSTVYISYYVIDPSPFAAFARACVKRYGSRIKHWQVWDEPDGMWDVLPNPLTYGILAKACSQAIKSADPSAQVLVAGTAGDGINVNYLIKTLLYVGAGNVDVISFHTFGQSPETLSRGLSIYEQIAGLDDTLKRLGFTQPFWNTSYGWQTGAGELTEAVQAQYLVRSFVQMAAIPRMEGATWFCLSDFGGPGFLFGISAIDFTPKPSYHAFRVLNEQLSHMPFQRRLDLGSPQRSGFVFASAGLRVTVLWLVGTGAAVTIPVTDSNLTRVSLDGAVTPLQAQDGRVTVTLSEEPFYLVERTGTDAEAAVSQGARSPACFSAGTSIFLKSGLEPKGGIGIHDLRGKRLSVLTRGIKSGDYLRFDWKAGRKHAAGVYYYRINLAKQVLSGKLWLVR